MLVDGPKERPLLIFFWLSRNFRENRTSFEGQPNIYNVLAGRESEL
jgi:hypothetical protein